MVVVGHPGHRRVTLFQEALARRGHPPAEVVAWRDLLAGRADLRQVARGALVRLESPGQDFEVEKLLLAAGAAEEETEDVGASFLPAHEALRLAPDPGRILAPRQWYRGLRAVLRRLDGLRGVRWLSRPGEVVTLFDKRLCHRLFAAAGVPVPPGLGPARCFDELLARMEAARMRQVFVKLACGSSAAGVVAFRAAGPRVQAVTAVELVQGPGPRLYHTRRVRVCERLGEVRELLDALCREGVQVEEWVPKAALGGKVFDVRVLVVGGEPRHVVVRLSATPMTNLHLLNERAGPARVRRRVPADRWEEALESCRRAAALFPGCLHVGVDLAFTPSYRRHFVLEANAFGDLLGGALWEGMDPYEAELLALEQAGRLGVTAPPAAP